MHVERLRPRLEFGPASLMAVRDLLFPRLQFIEPTLARDLEVTPEALRRHIRTLLLSSADHKNAASVKATLRHGRVPRAQRVMTGSGMAGSC
jgi:hypothetical protein